MFKDARTLDATRTAHSFDQGYRGYQANAEKWFDGSVDSVDRRLSHCERLLHYARSTTARMSVTDSQRYLRVAEILSEDRRVLQGLREDLLNGASGRADVNGPPGWRTAKTPLPGTSAGSNEFTHPAPRTKHPRYEEGAEIPQMPGIKQGHWFKDDGSYQVPNDGGPHPRMYSSPQEYMHARNLHHWVNQAQEMTPGGGDVAVPSLEHDMTRFRKHQSLDRPDKRWVALESAKFVAANSDALDSSHELATRAHNYAAAKTSTYPQIRSAAICEAFVEAVTDLGRRTYRPRVASAPPPDPVIDPQAIYLC